MGKVVDARIFSLERDLAVVNARSEELAATLRRNEGLEDQLIRTNNRIAAADKDLAVAQNQLSVLDLLKRDLETKLVALDAEEAALMRRTVQANEGNARITEYELKIRRLTERLEDADATVDSERVKVAEIIRERDVLQRELLQAQDIFRRDSDALAAARAEAAAAHEEADQLRRDLTRALSRIAQLTDKSRERARETADALVLADQNVALRGELDRMASRRPTELFDGPSKEVLRHGLREQDERADALHRGLVSARSDAANVAMQSSRLHQAVLQIRADHASEGGMLRHALAAERVRGEQRHLDALRAERENVEHRTHEIVRRGLDFEHGVIRMRAQSVGTNPRRMIYGPEASVADAVHGSPRRHGSELRNATPATRQALVR